MKISNNIFARSFKKFAADVQGGVALIVGICLVAVLLGVLSLTIDLGRTQTSYNKNQDATDAAALGVAEFILKGIVDQIGKRPDPYNWKPTDAEMNIYATTLLEQNFALEQSSARYDPSSLLVTYEKTDKDPKVDGNIRHKVTVTACADLTTPLSAAARHADKTRTCTTSEAAFSMAELANLEVAFALDFTNSMFWAREATPGTAGEDPCLANTVNTTDKCPPFEMTKANKLKEAMEYVFDNYFKNSSVYASVVPYSSVVNLYPYSKVMVNQTSVQPTGPSGEYFNYDYKNRSGKSYHNFTNISPFLTDYPISQYKVLNRLPTIESSAKLNSIVTGANAGEPGSVLPFRSYADQYQSMLGENETVRTGYCYNGAIVAALDQRIEQAETPPPNFGIVVTPENAGKTYECPAGYSFCTAGVRYSLRDYNKNRVHELHESFPIQPLTNNLDILKGVVGRFTAETNLFSNNGPATDANSINFQKNILNRAAGFTAPLGTSSFHGLMWSWFTINNSWKNRWNTMSVSENYMSSGSSSLNSRNGLPDSKNTKHIILLSDGHDNDGVSTDGSSPMACDSYTPIASITDGQYNSLCDAIKGQNIKIHILLLDFNQRGDRFSKCASSAETFHNNVRPEEVKGIMDGIFKTIITDLVNVKLVK